MKNDAPETWNLARGNHVVPTEWAEELERDRNKLKLKNEELRNIIEALTKGKLPCNPDHNGECLVCDNWLSDCPLAKNEKNT